mgnify:CR=1 FL=1
MEIILLSDVKGIGKKGETKTVSDGYATNFLIPKKLAVRKTEGSVQVLMPLPDGDGIKLTIAKYYTPNGENINGIGIEPDIKVEEKDDYLFYDGLITNINEKSQEKSKEKLLKSSIGEKEAKDLISREDKQLKAAEKQMLKMVKDYKNKK